MPRLSASTTRRHRSSTDSTSEVQTTTTQSKRTGHGTLYTWLLSLLATFLLGTVIVLSVVKSFFGVDWNDALDTEEVNAYLSLPTLPYGTPPPSTPSTEISIEKVPRIIHQTWKTTLLPTKWAKLTTQCKALHPDYEYKLWTDESSIEFIKEFYPWFLPTFMNYNLNIQRADVIRYFVLHKYGGVYMDLDIGCRRPMDPLLNFQTILPATKPIGISNDLIFAEPNSPFMDSVIHNLIAFDHYYLSDYPTVMFSTGPMFLSAVLSLWNSRSTYADVSSAPLTSRDGSASTAPLSFLSSSSKNSSATSLFGRDNALSPFEARDHGHTVRILPKELYGKNVLPELVPDAFFYHYYGSSWHQNDSFIFTFLGNFGKALMNIAFLVVIMGAALLIFRKHRRNKANKQAGLSSRSGNSDSGYRLALNYDSDIEDGSGRVIPSSLLPLPASSANALRPASSSRRSRRRHYRRAMAAGARNWLFGGISGNDTSTVVGGGRRRSASTGAISLPVQSAESGSEDALMYTSSSEDGRDTRRGSLLDRYQATSAFPGSQHVRRASVWTDDDDSHRDLNTVEGEGVISSSSRVASPLLRRTSSQPGLPTRDDVHSKTTASSGGETSFLEPPPPYRAPSPLSPTIPTINNNRSWLSSFFSTAPTTSSAQLPFFSNVNGNGTNSSNHSRSTSQDHLAPHNAFVSHSQLHSRSPSPLHSQSQSQSQDYISHTRNSSLADNEIEERDSDNFSLHSVKARR